MEPAYLSYFVIAIAVYYVTGIVWWKLQNSPPSPFVSLPILGQLYIMKFPITDTYTDLADRFGAIFSLRLGFRQQVIVSSPSAAENCLAENDVAFCNRPQGFLMGKYIGCDYTSLNFAPYSAHWRNLRKISAVEILSSQRLQSISSIRAEEVRSLIKLLYVKNLLNKTNYMDMKSVFLDTTMNMMTRTIFGKRYFGENISDEEGLRLRHMIADTVKLLNKETFGDYIWCLKWLDWKVEREFKEFSEKRDILLREIVEKHRLSWKQQDSKPKPLIQVLLELQDSNPDNYKDKVIRSIMADLLVGGSDSSAGTMEWAFSLLLNHPNVMKKAQAEIDNVIGYERFIDEGDLKQLPYLRCIINETLRMYPPFPHLLPRETSKDCVVGGYHVSRGAILQVNAYTIQNDPKLWDDPRSFRPERFIGVEGHRIGYKMMPFGDGRRSCPGEGLAIRVIGLTIGSLLQCFEWERVDHNLVDMTKFESFNLQRAKLLDAKIQPRQIMMKLLNQL